MDMVMAVPFAVFSTYVYIFTSKLFAVNDPCCAILYHIKESCIETIQIYYRLVVLIFT